jgi:hypothetical protein
MKFSICLLILLFIFSSFYSCQKDSAVTLAVDLTSQQHWDYKFSFKVGGQFSVPDSVSRLFSTIHCLLTCHVIENKRYLEVKVDNLHVTSSILDSSEVWHITNQIKDAKYLISLHNGFPNPKDSIIISAAKFDDLGLYQQLLRIFPSLPEKAVQPGFSWERDRMLPLSTSQGVAMCNVYQSFTFDSLGSSVDNNKYAYVSWLFRHSVDSDHIDTASLLKDLPSYGNGKGFAVVDIENKKLVTAEMAFTTPTCSLPDLSVNWEEVAILELVDRNPVKKE